MFGKFWNLLKIMLHPILFVIGQFLIMAMFLIIYILKHPTLDLNSSESTLLLSDYLNSNMVFILLLECLLFIPLFYSVYKKNKMNRKDYKISNALLIVGISFSLSAILNFIILFLKKIIGIELGTSGISLVIILSTGIIGPILEELLFRGIVYGKLLKYFSNNISFWLSIFIFAIFHTGGIFQILFAFIIGVYLTYIYSKYKDIKLSILSHIVVNVTSILITPLILILL